MRFLVECVFVIRQWLRFFSLIFELHLQIYHQSESHNCDYNHPHFLRGFSEREVSLWSFSLDDSVDALTENVFLLNFNLFSRRTFRASDPFYLKLSRFKFRFYLKDCTKSVVWMVSNGTYGRASEKNFIIEKFGWTGKVTVSTAPLTTCHWQIPNSSNNHLWYVPTKWHL